MVAAEIDLFLKETKMKEIKLGGHKLEIYDSIEDLPITRFHKFNKMLLIDAGIGSDITDFDNHIERAIRFSKTKPEITIKELENLRQCVYLIQTELNPSHLAFCTLIKKVDGEEWTDITTEGLKKLLGMISDVSNADISEESENTKKKVDTELQTYFPGLFENSEVKEYYDTLLRRTKLVLQGLIDRKDYSEEVERLTTLLLLFNEPRIFQGPKSEEVVFDKQFEGMCLAIAKELGTNAKEYTVLEYYSAYEHIKKQMKDGKRK